MYVCNAAAVLKAFVKKKREIAQVATFAEIVTTFDSHAAAWSYVNNNFGARSTLVLPRQGVTLVKHNHVWRPFISCLGGLKEWKSAAKGKQPKNAQLAVWDMLMICEHANLQVSGPLQQLFRFICTVVIEEFYAMVSRGEVQLSRKHPLRTSRPPVGADLRRLLRWFVVFALPTSSIMRRQLVNVTESVAAAVLQLLRCVARRGRALRWLGCICLAQLSIWCLTVWLFGCCCC